jgi:predicted RNase H-like nuclease (RuvC/YqgF family)
MTVSFGTNQTYLHFRKFLRDIDGNLWNSRTSHLISATTNLDGDAIVMAEKPRPLEQMLDLTEDEPSAEHLDNQVQKAQEQLLQLKRQQEQIEKQKRELEELSRRQDELEQGRGEMTDKLTRALVVLEREAYNAQSRLEQIRLARESFAQHLELVEAIDPRNWNPSDLHKELSRALSTVDDARTEYNEHRSRLQAAGGGNGDQSLPDTAPGVYENSNGRSFSEWLQIGLALSLPLILFGVVAIALLFWMNSR